VHVEDFPKLLEDENAARAFSALDELLRAGALQQRDSHYVLAQRAMVDALLRVADEDARKRAHVRLARIFDQELYQGRMMTVRQLQRAGEHARACDLLVKQALGRFGSGSMDWSMMRISLQVECAQNALEYWQAQGGSPRDGILLRRLVLLSCSVSDWSLARFGQPQLEQLRKDTGLSHWDETDPTQPVLNRTLACLKLAQQRYEATPEAERGLPPVEAVRELASCSISLSGARVNAHEVSSVRELPELLAPLRPLSAAIPLLADVCELGADRLAGREIGSRLLDVSLRLLESNEISEVLRHGASAVLIHLQAVEDARRGRSRTEELLKRTAVVVSEDMFLIVHARWLSHAFGGRAAEARPLQKQLELTTEDDMWRRRATLFVEAQLHALTGDLFNLTHVSEAIAELALKFEGWRPWSAWTRAAIHRLRGQLAAAETELELALELARPGEHRAWVLAAPARAELRLLSGDAATAIAEAEEILRTVATLSLDRSAAIAAGRVRALALSSQGDHAAARTSIEAAFESARELEYDGLPLADLYEARARIALAAGEQREASASLSRMKEMLEHADAPALVHKYEALRDGNPLELTFPSLAPEATSAHTAINQSTAIFTEVQTRMNSCSARDTRARQALALLLEASGAAGGHLFLFDAGGLFPAASHEQSQPSEKLLALAQEYVAADICESKTVTVNAADLTAHGTTMPTMFTERGSRLVPVLLCDYDGERGVLSGLALLSVGGKALQMPRNELTRAISRCLQAAGDSLAVAME
jgi:tetratricopeptide (TPR) repeat protein